MNTKQSSTGNVYGIYDLSGGAYEATSAYYNIATNQDLSNNGGELVSENKQSGKYVTVYNSSILSSFMPNFLKRFSSLFFHSFHFFSAFALLYPILDRLH